MILYSSNLNKVECKLRKNIAGIRILDSSNLNKVECKSKMPELYYKPTQT